MSVLEIYNKESKFKRIIKILIISGWYGMFSSYPLGNADNQVVRYLVVITMTLLTLLFVVLFIVTAIKYKGPIIDMFKAASRLDVTNSFLFIAVSIFEYHFCPEAYQVIVAYAALTIMVINCVLFIFDNSCDIKKHIQE